MQETGWIKLHRSILKWEWWDDHNTTRLFIYLLAKSNHKVTRYMGHEIPAGASVCGYPKMALDTGLTIQNIRTAIKRLKSTGELTVKKTPNFSIITITNWSSFQEANSPANSQLTVSQQSSNSHLTTSKELKNKRIKEYIPDNVCSSVWNDFVKLRKTKKAAITETAINRIESQAKKIGWTLEQALIECCNRGWTGFNSSWIDKAESKKTKTTQTPNAKEIEDAIKNL